jgi:non-specific serine/threonine protein kinase
MRDERSVGEQDAATGRAAPLERRYEVSTREAARILGRSERTIQRAIANGEIAATRVGSAYRISRDELARLASVAPPPPPSPPSPPPAAIVALPSPAESMASLPEPLSSFVGRQVDLERLVALLEGPAARVITVTGAGGIGKTRLAVAAASIVQDRFADGVVFVGLEAIRRPEQVLPAMARALGVRERAGQPRQEQLQRFLRHKQLLLLLDNVEQVLAAAPEVAALAAAAKQVRVLVTSRAPLRVSGEREFPLAPLGLPLDGVSVAEVISSDAGRLFVERAQEHAAGFSLDEASAPLVADICARLDGLPLAIELAAARVNVLAPGQLQARLQHRLSLLTRGRRDASPRHGTMRDAIAWSYDLLPAPEQRLFRCLAAFDGGFTLDAAAFMAGTGEAAGTGATGAAALDMVADLAEQSLLVSAVGLDGTPRFRMLETLREFGLEQLAAAGEEAPARARHAAYFLALARDLRLWVSTHARHAPLDQLAAEQANLDQALGWLDRHGPAADFTELVAALGEYWYTVNQFRDGQRWLERALARQAQATASDRAGLLIGYAAVLFGQGRFDEANATLAEALPLSETACGPPDRARALMFSAFILFVSGRYREAEAPLREAHAEADHLDDPILRAAVAWRPLANLGMCARGQGDFARDMAYCEAALQLFEGKDLDLAEAISLMNYGAAAFASGDHRLAVERWREGVSRTGERGDLRQVADALSGIANVATAWGNARAALLLFGAADAIRERMGTPMLSPLDIGPAERSLGILRALLGEEAVAAGLREGRMLSPRDAAAVADGVVAPAERTSAGSSGSFGLTHRELEVLRLVADHKTDQMIADALFLSRRTVNWHVRSILARLGCATRGEAVARARNSGLI